MFEGVFNTRGAREEEIRRASIVRVFEVRMKEMGVEEVAFLDTEIAEIAYFLVAAFAGAVALVRVFAIPTRLAEIRPGSG